MAYTELTCDDDGLSLETLYRMSMIDMGDGTYAQRVVDGSSIGPSIAFSMTSGAVIGDYYQDGVDGNGSPMYFKVGGNPATDKIIDAGDGSWLVLDSAFPDLWIYINPPVDFPYNGTDWIDALGEPPTPVFTLP